MHARLYLILFWIIVGILLAAVGQNFTLGQSILSNDVFIVMGILVVLVFCDEVLKSLNSKARIRRELEETLGFENRRRGIDSPRESLQSE